jgi:hypothetical protein
MLSAEVRKVIALAMDERNERGIRTPLDLLREVKALDTEEAHRFVDVMRAFRPRIIVNDVRTAEDIRLGFSVRSVCRKYFAIDAEYLGYVNHDSARARSVRARRPLVDSDPRSDAAVYLARIARKLIAPRLEAADEASRSEPKAMRSQGGMKPLTEQDYYETLDVARSAGFEDIERAYRLAATPIARTRSRATRCSRSATSSSCASGSRSPTGSSSTRDARAYDRSSPRSVAARCAGAARAATSPQRDVRPAAPVLAPLDALDELERRGRVDRRAAAARAAAPGHRARRDHEDHQGEPDLLTFIEDERFDGLPARSTCAASWWVMRMSRPRREAGRGELPAALRRAPRAEQAPLFSRK